MRTPAAALVSVLLLVSVSVRAAGSELPDWVTSFDSGTRVVREVAEALTGEGRGILESYPWGSRTFLGLLGLFPSRWRIAGIECGMRLGLGWRPEAASQVDLAELAAWCVAQYGAGTPGTSYDAIVIGSPNGGVAHLAALLGVPFLTSSFAVTFRHPTIDPTDVDAYLRTAQAAAERIVGANPESTFEIVCHVDPLHDRSIVRFVDFLRIKPHELPEAYRRFIAERLAPGGRLILIDCTYEWPQRRLSDRITLQVGGLGDIAPEHYLSRWPIDAAIEIRRESEWGCPEAFADAVRAFATTEEIELIELAFDHPWDYSLLAYDAYLACDGSLSDELLIDCFNHQNPRTNTVTGIPPLWLPFNTTDALAAIEEFLAGRSFGRIRFTVLPSFAASPDTAELGAWLGLFEQHGPVETIGLRLDRFPADVLAPFRFASDMEALRKMCALPAPLRLEIVEFEELVRAAASPRAP
ncbi:hypothetical protein KJ567_05075 [Candidatus Bipolaricaulota bacterium]|nr:hypothetical protein [Candidatus Bipolaricaulota bacterium]